MVNVRLILLRIWRTASWFSITVVMFLVSVIVMMINIKELHIMQAEHLLLDKKNIENDKKPKVCFLGKNSDQSHLVHVMEVLKSLGYEITKDTKDWDILWSHDYPFKEYKDLLAPVDAHKKINHFPGTGYVTNKMNLVTTPNISGIPKAFKIPKDKEDLLLYVKGHQDKLFVQKSNSHRGIKIENIDNLDLETEGTFMQEFIQDPFLIDGHKFDIGVYVIVTSIDPLRVYTYDNDALFRFCPEKYYPFDAANINKYVVTDDYLPIWEVPSLKHLYNDRELTMKGTFNAYLRSQGLDTQLVWRQIESIVQDIMFAKESALIGTVKKYYSDPPTFFELIRFDFILTKDMKIYVMEANMSPNLSSAHFPSNRLLYEQILYNLFSLVGVAQHVHLRYTDFRSKTSKEMEVSNRDIAIQSDVCGSKLCKDGCSEASCQICIQCLSHRQKTILRRTFKEHVNKRLCKRLIPSNLNDIQMPLESFIQGLTGSNQWLYRWLDAMCEKNTDFC